MRSSAVSAPGKVLLAGGYLVLDRAYTGLVFGLSARIHVVISDLDDDSHDSGDAAFKGVEVTGLIRAEIVVRSPQFAGAEWRYEVGVMHDLAEARSGCGQPERVVVTQRNLTTGVADQPRQRNPFVESALNFALNYLYHIHTTSQPSSPSSPLLRPLAIRILADNAYYSNPPSPSSNSNSTSRFADFGIPFIAAHKTGLGSSAALTTALTGALLAHYSDIYSDARPETLDVTHVYRLAQIAHCAAQGKVGSGFDVAAAAYGTCIYRRFSDSAFSTRDQQGKPGISILAADQLPDFPRRLWQTVAGNESGWDDEQSKDRVSIPKGYKLVMCDVDCGSETVGMVKKVLAWRAQDPNGSLQLWDELQIANEQLARTLASIDGISDGTAYEKELRMEFERMRLLIRKMGDAAGVAIEPLEQSRLIDALLAVDGVIGGVVPGAGGYDAVVLLIRDDEHTQERVAAFLVRWTETVEGTVKLLDVKGEMEGVRVEKLELYAGWLGK